MKYSISKLLLFLFALALIPGLAFAGADYPKDRSRTTQGGGTWGSILQLSVQLHGSTAHFFVSKQEGAFNIDNVVQIRSGSPRGPVLTDDTIRRGVRTVELLLDLDHNLTEDSTYYAYIANSYGHAWVGPVQLDMPHWNPDPWPHQRPRPQSNLSKALLAEQPGQVRLHEQIQLRVTAGTCPQVAAVQVRCSAEDSNWPLHNPYISGWVRPGSTVEVPLIFSRLGKKQISCYTFDQCCSSPMSQRSIVVLPKNRPPLAPEIRLAPGPVAVHNVALFSILPGKDPDGDPVRVECTAENSNRTAEKPYLSGWFNAPRWTDAHFVFFRAGSQQLSCVTVDRKGQSSPATTRLVQVDNPLPPPPPPSSGGKRIETKIEISVSTDADGTHSEIRVESSKSDSLHPLDEISFDRPYLPDYNGHDFYYDDDLFVIPVYPSPHWQHLP